MPILLVTVNAASVDFYSLRTITQKTPGLSLLDGRLNTMMEIGKA